VLRLVQTVGWLACVIYSTIPWFWLLIHSGADYWRVRQRSPYRILLPAWIGMGVVVAVITAPWRHVLLYHAAWTWIPALPLFAAGGWLYAQSGKHFSKKQLGGLPELMPDQAEQRLVTSGIRARVRHPVYLAHLCEMLAWGLGTGLMAAHALTAMAVVAGALMIRMEDAELERRFGDEFRAYRKRVPSLLPNHLSSCPRRSGLEHP